MLEVVFTWAGVGTGAFAAWLWLRSTRVHYRRRREDIAPQQYGIWLKTKDPDVVEQPFLTAEIQNRINALAAGFTALAVAMQALSLIAHHFGW